MFPESRSAIYFTHFWAFVPLEVYNCTLAPFALEPPFTSNTAFSASADWNVYEPSEFLMAIHFWAYVPFEAYCCALAPLAVLAP